MKLIKLTKKKNLKTGKFFSNIHLKKILLLLLLLLLMLLLRKD